jgi:transposase, IS5 family
MPAIFGRVEHVFRVITRQFGYTRVQQNDLAKNANQMFTLNGLTILYLARQAMLT